jgi:hypothetical protein
MNRWILLTIVALQLLAFELSLTSAESSAATVPDDDATDATTKSSGHAVTASLLANGLLFLAAAFRLI